MLPNIYIPSYKRAGRNKTLNYFLAVGVPPEDITVVVDDQTPDLAEYRAEADETGTHLLVFDMERAIAEYDFVTLPNVARRTAGLARNQIWKSAKKNKKGIFVVLDDDTSGFEIKANTGDYLRMAKLEDIERAFSEVVEFMEKRRIGLFGLPQTGDFIGGQTRGNKVMMNKVMNTTFINPLLVQAGERGLLDTDTSQFLAVGVNGLFTGSTAWGLTLKQTPSAVSKGGLTEVYKDARLFVKSMMCPLQCPSAVSANYQPKNGGRIHHTIQSRYVNPKILRSMDDRTNIAWDTYPEDTPITLARRIADAD